MAKKKGQTVDEVAFGLKRYVEHLKNPAIFSAVVTEVSNSIKFGSALTGAPGQPVDTGNLRDSWTAHFRGPTRAIVATNVEYARSIEDGRSYAHAGRPIQLRSGVGGFHSVKMTRANYGRLARETILRFLGKLK